MLIDKFVLFYLTQGKSKRTAEEYAKEIAYFARYMRKSHDIQDLSDEDLLLLATKQDAYAYATYCMVERDNSAATRARKISSLRAFYAFLVKFDVLIANPFESLDRPKVDKTLPVFLSLDDAKLLIRTARTLPDLFYRRRNACIIIWFLNLGLRLSELANIKMIDIYDDAVIVRGKGAKERIAYLNKSCLRALRLWLHWRGQEDGYLFTAKDRHGIQASTISSMIKSLCRKAGLPERISTHKLRHTAATLLYRYGQADLLLLSEILGHESVSTTQIYTHVADERIMAAMDSHPLSDF